MTILNFWKIAEAGLKSHVKHLRGEFMHGNKYIQINKDRTNRHLVSSNLIENGISKLTLNSTVWFFQNFEKQNWESKSVLFNNPSVPVIYPSSGLRVEPDEVLKVPIKIIKVSGTMGKWNLTGISVFSRTRSSNNV